MKDICKCKVHWSVDSRGLDYSLENEDGWCPRGLAHYEKMRQALREFVSQYQTYIVYHSDFNNVYTCGLASIDREIPERAYKVSPEKWVNKYTWRGDAATEVFKYFEFLG